MVSHHLTIDEFFIRLAELFESRRKRDHGSVFLIQKRLSHGNDDLLSSNSSPNLATLDKPFADLHPASPLPVLMRATTGTSKEKAKEKAKEKIKISTIVQPEALEAFFVRYAEVCKSGMQGLRKRDRSGRKKAKAKKRKGGADAEKKA
ncbi:hypothetical protein MMC13_000226 [Lambiella insularis]|nr:hypothetical protein [Lambiella insularis]